MTRERTAWLWRAGVLLLLVPLVDGCIFPVTNQADGESCGDNGECKSGRCNQGFCAGGSCKLSDPSSCDDGWKCTHSDPDAISGFFGSNGSDTCKPTCGHCPGNMHCTKDQPSGSICMFGKAPLELSLAIPPGTLVGAPVEIVASAAPPSGRLVECHWEFGDGKPVTTPNGQVTHRFSADAAREYTIAARCKDDGGRSGGAEAKVPVSCLPSGAACAPTECCAEPKARCLEDPAGGLRCRVPVAPAIVVSGPTEVPIRTEVEYAAAVSGGDGTIGEVKWTFGDTSFKDSGSPVRHSFSKAGVMSVTASVTTTAGAAGQQVYPVTVCQVANGSCDRGEPCCAPLLCTGTTFRRCGP
jgi:hypothetical protein